MKFLSLEPFVPSGANYTLAKLFFTELGFHINWEQEDCAGFQKNDCRFILQDYNVPAFAENFMLSVKVEDAEAFRNLVMEKQLPQKYGIRVSNITQQPYGKEVTIVDMAGVCWHFVEQ